MAKQYDTDSRIEGQPNERRHKSEVHEPEIPIPNALRNWTNISWPRPGEGKSPGICGGVLWNGLNLGDGKELEFHTVLPHHILYRYVKRSKNRLRDPMF